MISVIIPVLNESGTIASVVEFARRNRSVSEVIVVDDGSVDGTPELARSAGATVIPSTLLGKGASMEDGMRAAHNEVLVFLDGDLQGLRDDLIESLTEPIIAGRADFVKAKFSRSAGRVTTLTARPLLRIFFPQLARFVQPLSGIIAARRSLLQKLSFENDYGVDIGLLIDADAAGARLTEVDIGHIEHDSHPLEVLGDMACQVARTLLNRAARSGRLNVHSLRQVEEIERRTELELPVLLTKVEEADRLALFDMDGVLLDGRFIVELARRTGRSDQLERFLDHPDLHPDDRTRQIAALFAGIPKEGFINTAREMPLMAGACEVVLSLRKAGYRVGIVTDSYFIVAETVRRRVFADFSIANLMKFRGQTATGRITLSPAMRHPDGCPSHPVCKFNALKHLTDRMRIDVESVLAVGDGENDICMLEAAGQSIAFQPKLPAVAAAARHVVEGDLTEVLRVLTPELVTTSTSEDSFSDGYFDS